MSTSRRRLRIAAMVALALVLTLAKLGSATADQGETPGAPTGLVAVAGDGSVRVWFNGPSSAGESSIRYYRVSIFLQGEDTEFHADGTTSPITVRGLTNGVGYTAKVKARNSSGFGTSSKPTPAFVPWRTAAAASSRTITTSTSTATSTTTPTTRSTTTTTRITAATTGSTTGSNGTAAATRITTSPSSIRVPGDLLDLHRWRLNLPVDSKRATSGESALVRQPALRGYTDASFALNPAGDGVVFKAGVGGATTENSDYARSELRELSASGSLAAWRAESGTHTLRITGSIDHLPLNRPQVSAVQIHGSSDIPLIVMATGRCDAYCNHDSRTRTIPPGTVRLLTKENDGTSYEVLDPGYVLGSRYSLTIQVRDRLATLTYKNLGSGIAGTRSFRVKSGQELYFKAGSYTLSNLESDAASAYGQTTINALSVTHTS